MVKLMSYWSISSQVLVEEAEKLWLRVEIINREKNLFLVSSDQKEVLFKSTDCGLNSSLWLKIANDKELTYDMLQRAWLPVAHTKYVTEWDIDDNFDDSWFSYPLVIKPLDGAHGDGVVMNIQDKKQLLESLKVSFEEHRRMIIQDQVEWDEYRILVVKGEVLLARRRAFPSIVWNWESTIAELIKIENIWNKLRWEWYNKPLSYIKIDAECEKCLDMQWYSLESIIGNWLKVIVRSNSNIWTWWVPEDVTSIISEEYKRIAIWVAATCDLWIAWVDLLTGNIAWKDIANCTVLEVWATPWIWWDRELTSVNTWKELLRKVFII